MHPSPLRIDAEKEKKPEILWGNSNANWVKLPAKGMGAGYGYPHPKWQIDHLGEMMVERGCAIPFCWSAIATSPQFTPNASYNRSTR